MPLVPRVFDALLKLPPPLTRDVEVRRDVAVAAGDGTALLTDLYLARPADPLPVILIRTPYGRRGFVGGGLAARHFAERGYHAVVQSTRGTSGSGGTIDFDRYDPAEPTPVVGGTGTGPNSGPRDNRELEARPDVLTFSTEPLAAAIEITGPVRAELYVTSTLAHTDFFARLCDVDPKGRSTNVTDGLTRLTGDSQLTQPVLIDLWPTAYQFAAGHRIRLQVSSGAHPRFARNPGSGEPLATATTLRVAEQTIHHDPDRPSAVLLPVTTGGRAGSTAISRGTTRAR